MWLVAASSGAQDTQNALVLAIVGAGSGLLVAIATGLFQLLSAKQGRQSTSPESAQTLLFERTAVLSNRVDDHDDVLAVTERRLDQIERHIDLDNPAWRVPPGPLGHPPEVHR